MSKLIQTIARMRSRDELAERALTMKEVTR